MRVVIDTNGLYSGQAGVARYIRGLLKGFRRLAGGAPTLSELAWPVENFDYQQPARTLKTFYRELIWPWTVARRSLGRSGADIFHSTALPLVRAAAPTRNVITLHDLAVLAYPQRFRPWHRYAVRRGLKKLSRADRVICVSRFTLDEAATRLGLATGKMVVVYNGCDFHAEEGPAVEEPPLETIPERFFLFVGSLEPGKNLALLRRVYELAEAQRVALPELVVVGTRWHGVAGEGRPPANWRYLGRQSDAVLVYLYRRAMALVFPSQYEGFGLPLVEAMSLKCPVICSRVASLPEVGGDAVFYCDPTPQAYYEAMRELSRRPELRTALVAKGLAQAANFSWSKSAEGTLAVYSDTLNRG